MTRIEDSNRASLQRALALLEKMQVRIDELERSRVAEIPVGEDESAFRVLSKDVLRQRLNQRLVE